ncbi:hypothetical protein IFM89_034515 [Coptis chinensis]|uniref:Uncharacterized protein n=1 Tax=Coptis chinensis TaxID=261450 RepID=A0A835HRM8_9MAGN|nr:hypothetical protein IFM89_034515 [Coptis chinensis]
MLFDKVHVDLLSDLSMNGKRTYLKLIAFGKLTKVWKAFITRLMFKGKRSHG